jgi:hypothetical protein
MLAIKQASGRCRNSTKICSFLLPRKSVGLHTSYDPKFNSLFFFYQKNRVSKKLLAIVLYVVLALSPPRRHPSCFLPSFLPWRMLCFFLLRRFSTFPLEATICPNCTRAIDPFISELVWPVLLAQVFPRPQLIFLLPKPGFLEFI